MDDRDITAIQAMLDPLLPGLLGVRLVSVEPDRVVAELEVRPALCTTGGILHGGAYMAFADTLGAVGTFISLPKGKRTTTTDSSRSEEHTSELQSQSNLVCRLLLEKKKI